jgi:large-conductance mechanosensitive channel
MDGNAYIIGSASQHLVDRVINDFIDQVVKRFSVGTPDVHAGAAANSF